MKHITHALVLIGCGGLSGLANALSAATPEGVVCSVQQIFVGKVLSAKSMDCRLTSAQGRCSPDDRVSVSVQVERIVLSSPVPAWASESAPAEGKNITVGLSMYSSGHNTSPPLLKEYEKIITNEVADDLLKDKTFVFSTWEPGAGRVYPGIATQPDSLPWIEETLKRCRSK